MVDENLLSRLYSARLDELREMAISRDIPKGGNVEQLRARLINEVALVDTDLSWDSLQEMPNKELALGNVVLKKCQTSGHVPESNDLTLHLGMNCFNT